MQNAESVGWMSDNPLIKKIKALIALRAFFVTLLLGSFFLFQIGYGRFPYPQATPYLIIFLYSLTIVYALIIRRVKNLNAFAYTQLSIDALSVISLILMTGGIQSWFSSIMLLTVISSSIVLNKKAGYVMATLSSILYGSMIDLQLYGVLPISFDPMIREKDFLYNIFAHISALYLTAYLTGYLSSRLEKTTKRLEEKDIDLRDLALFNKEIIENVPSGLFTTDLTGRILIFNTAAENIAGVKREIAIGQQVGYVFPFLEHPAEIERMEGIIKHKEGSKIIGLTLSAIKDADGNKTGFIGIFQDLTQLKKMEAEMKYKEKWAAIGELSASMAHEIRNPLASLKGSIEMLREDTMTGRHKDRLMVIAIGEMERLNRIITDFLTYSRPNAPEFTTFDLHLVLDETLELLKNTVENKALRQAQDDGRQSKGSGSILIKRDFSGALEITADHQKLRQVFWNLGLNAFEAMPDGGELRVSTRDCNNFVEIVFRDSGIGIPSENIEKIFYPFFTTKEAGTGLGLSIAYRIIEEHNGRMTVSSNPDKGTTFDITIPKGNGKSQK